MSILTLYVAGFLFIVTNIAAGFFFIRGRPDMVVGVIQMGLANIAFVLIYYLTRKKLKSKLGLLDDKDNKGDI